MLSLNWPEGVLSELLYVDDLVLINKMLGGLRNRLIKWKEAFKSKGVIVKLGKA